MLHGLHPRTSTRENLAGVGDTAVSVHISLRLMADQLEHLESVAEARGLSRSHVLRRLIDASLTPEERGRLPGSDELLILLAERARAGNVAAIRALLDRVERNADAEREASEFDELDAWMDTDNVNEGGRHGR